MGMIGRYFCLYLIRQFWDSTSSHKAVYHSHQSCLLLLGDVMGFKEALRMYSGNPGDKEEVDSRSYYEKLKDPRWQKVRLQVFERDNFLCQKCFDDKVTLNVHHRIYIKIRDPWDYPLKYLVTLCEDCHELERADLFENTRPFLDAVKSKFFGQDLKRLTDGFKNLESKHTPEMIALIIEWILSNNDVLDSLNDKYLKSVYGVPEIKHG